MKVLFSPVGSTDPISNCRDGGMLHICRVYRPDKVYLYLSKEMCKYHDQDNRYVQAIQWLAKEEGFTCEVECIFDREMEEVQIFDMFIMPFEKMLQEIREKESPEEILVNVSSGTPAMKSSLQMISLLHNDMRAIQVSTPAKSSNKVHEDKDNYELEIQWECDEDRKEGFENRCIESKAKRLLDRIKRENIVKYIDAYDYEAAKMMAEQLYELPQQEFLDCLEIAIQRTKLNLRYVNENRKQLEVNGWFPVTKDREMGEFEYLLSMQTKLWKKQYVDFVRDVTPIFYSLSERALKKYCNLSFEDIGTPKGNAWFLSPKKLKQLKITPEVSWRDTTNISAYNVMKIMEQKNAPSDILKLMKDIRKVEKEVRHMAAHQIVGATSQWIEKQTGFTVDQIMDKIFEFAKLVQLPVSKENRMAYKTMNQELEQMLAMQKSE